MERALRIGKLLGIPTVDVVGILGDLDDPQLLAIAIMTDIKLLAAIYESNPVGSRKREVALDRWEMVSFQKAQRARTIPTLRKIYELSPESGSAQDFAYNKWNILSLREVESARTIRQLKKAFKRAPAGSEAETLAVFKIAAQIPRK